MDKIEGWQLLISRLSQTIFFKTAVKGVLFAVSIKSLLNIRLI